MSRLLSRVAALVCLPAALAAQNTFEGVVTVRFAGGGRGGEATYYIKGTDVRADMSGGAGMTMSLLHTGTNANTLVMHGQKQYMEMPAFGGMMPGAAQRGAAQKMPDFKWTGRKETIAGVECEHMLITSDEGNQIDACMARGMGRFMAMGNPMGGRAAQGGPPDVLARMGGDAFPLKVEDPAHGGTIMEVTKIEKKSLDASVFAVPADYQKIDMGRMGRPPV